jgi:predicted permease
MSGISRPPRLARTLVASLLRGDMREIVLGDLDEEFARNLERGTTVSRARRRYWRQALASVIGRAPREERRITTPSSHGRPGAAWVTDLRDAGRGLRVSRGTMTLAFVMLTVAIAAGTVTFSVVDALAIRQLPYRDVERLAAVARISPRDSGYASLAPQDYFALQAGVSAFDGLAGSGRWSLPGDTPNSPPIIGARTTLNFFDVLGVAPMLGHGFQPGQDQAGDDGVIVLSDHLWSQRFGSDPHIVGRHARFGAQTRVVLGVMPKDFAFWMYQGQAADFWVPYVPTAQDRSEASRGRSYFLQVFGRLHPGSSIDQVESQAIAVAAGLNPSYQRAGRFAALPLQDFVIGPAKSWLLLMLAAVGLVLFASCINVANLLLARGTTRRRELATREALGASRARLARTLLFEGLLLAVGAAIAGVGVSYWGVQVAKSLLPAGLARAGEIAVDGRVLMVSVSAAVLCGLIFGTAPALQASRTDLVTAIKNDGGAIIGGRARRRWLGALLVAEVAFVVTLLVGTGLVVGTFIRIVTMDLGFDRRDVVAFAVMKSLSGVPKSDRAAASEAFLNDVTERVRGVSGVITAAVVQDGVPMSGGSARYSIKLPDGVETGDTLTFHPVTPNYFQAMGVRLLHGRVIDTSDRVGAPLVALINDTAARQFFPNVDPVGQIITFRGPTTIVGVVAATHVLGPEQEAQPELYVPLSQELQTDPIPYGDLVVRVRHLTPELTARLAAAIAPALGTQKVPEPKSLNDLFAKVTAQRRFSALVLSVFGGVSAVIAAIGIYGVIAFIVAQQLREIGLRLALGASSRLVLVGVIGGAAKYVAAGVLIGLLGARATSRVFASLLFGIRATDSRVYFAVALVLLGIGVIAALAPARRAARVDPLIALRSE